MTDTEKGLAAIQLLADLINDRRDLFSHRIDRCAFNNRISRRIDLANALLQVKFDSKRHGIPIKIDERIYMYGDLFGDDKLTETY
jgi:hypothetical protein